MTAIESGPDGGDESSAIIIGRMGKHTHGRPAKETNENDERGAVRSGLFIMARLELQGNFLRVRSARAAPCLH